MPMFRPPTFESKEEERESLKGRFAAAFRILGHRGYNENAGGIMTLRDPVEPNTFWINPAATHWTLLQPSDLLHVNQEGTLVAHSGRSHVLDTEGFLVHAAIFATREDVVCVAQARPPHGLAFSHLGKELDPITQDSCAFYQDNSVYDGVMWGEEGVRGVAAALGGRKVCSKLNHVSGT